MPRRRLLRYGSEHTPSESAMHKLRHDKTIAANALTYREREIIKLPLWPGRSYSYTLEETGRIFKVTPRTPHSPDRARCLPRKLQHHTRSNHLAASSKTWPP